jgi:hypothetical protein
MRLLPPAVGFSLTTWSVIANPTDAPIFAHTFLLPRQLRRPDAGVARRFPRIRSASEKQRGQSPDDCQVLHNVKIRRRGFFGCFFFLAFAHKSPRRIVRYELSCFARIMGIWRSGLMPVAQSTGCVGRFFPSLVIVAGAMVLMGSGNSMSTRSIRGTPLDKQRALGSSDQKVDSASPPYHYDSVMSSRVAV